MSGIILREVDDTTVPTPATDKAAIFIDAADGEPKYKDDTGTVHSFVAAGSMTNPMTTEGDLVVADTGGTPLRLGVGSEGDVLTIVSGVPAYAAAPGGAPDWGDIGGTLSDQTDLQAALDAKAGNAYTIITEASPFTADPGTHDGLSRLVLAAGDVTFDDAEPYTAGMAFNIRATAAIDLVESDVTLTPPAGGTLGLDADMAVQVVMTGATTGIVIGQTVAAP